MRREGNGSVPFPGRQGIPVTPCRLEEDEGADDIGLDKGSGAVDGAVDVTLGGKVDDGPRPVLPQEGRDELPVTYITLDKGVAFVAAEAGQALEVAGVGEEVEVDHRGNVTLPGHEHEVRTDEARTARYENCLIHCLQL